MIMPQLKSCIVLHAVPVTYSWACAALFLLAGTLAAAIPVVFEGPSKPWNIKGDLLVLDVSSLKYQGSHSSPYPDLRTPEACAGVCNKTVGCNAWTYCNSTAGCSSGCEEYVKANPQRECAAVTTGSRQAVMVITQETCCLQAR
jgi:hypothetical protein